MKTCRQLSIYNPTPQSMKQILSDHTAFLTKVNRLNPNEKQPMPRHVINPPLIHFSTYGTEKKILLRCQDARCVCAKTLHKACLSIFFGSYVRFFEQKLGRLETAILN